MKKTLAVLMFLFFISGMGNNVFAQDEHTLHSFYIEPNVQYVIPLEDELDEDMYFGGKFGYQLSDFISIEVDSGYTRLDFINGGGEFEMIPVLVNLRMDLPIGLIVYPYVFGGAGYAFNEIEVAGLPGAEVDDSFAAHAGAGAEFPLNESIALYVDGRYFYSEPEVNFSFFGEDKIQVHSILVGGGVIIRF